MNKNETKLLTIKETSELLRIQSNTLRVWISRQEVIPQSLIIRLGRRVLFDYKRLAEWIEGGCKAEIT